MLIGKKYRIESDALNVTLYEKEVAKKTGVIRWRPIAYFSNIKWALRHFANLELKLSGLKDMEAVNKKQEEILAVINSLKLY